MSIQGRVDYIIYKTCKGQIMLFTSGAQLGAYTNCFMSLELIVKPCEQLVMCL